jgi:hypothetical protein
VVDNNSIFLLISVSFGKTLIIVKTALDANAGGGVQKHDTRTPFAGQACRRHRIKKIHLPDFGMNRYNTPYTS